MWKVLFESLSNCQNYRRNNMKNTLIQNIAIYCLLIQYTRSQYNQQVYSGMQQEYHYPYQGISYPQHSNQRSYKNYEHKWIQENYEDYNGYEEENCPCDKCVEIIVKPACRDVCPNCFTLPVIAPSYVFLPFPYPVSPNTALAPTAVEETTTASTTTSTKVTIKEVTDSSAKTESIATKFDTEKNNTTDAAMLSNALLDENNEVLKDQSPFNINSKGKYVLTAVRRTKPHLLPKYGIVPISDKFAEKLMLQIRSMKVLHPQKDNVRDIDDITPM